MYRHVRLPRGQPIPGPAIRRAVFVANVVLAFGLVPPPSPRSCLSRDQGQHEPGGTAATPDGQLCSRKRCTREDGKPDLRFLERPKEASVRKPGIAIYLLFSRSLLRAM